MADPTDPTDVKQAATEAPSDTKVCPMCGETIKAVAIRCKHCQADLSSPDFDRGIGRGVGRDIDQGQGPGMNLREVARELERPRRVRTAKPDSPEPRAPEPIMLPDGKINEVEFERRFLDFAYETHERINAISVAHALKIPIAQADEKLEHLAASDVLHRDVDDEGSVFYSLPGLRKNAMVSTRPGALLHAAHSGPNSLTPNGIVDPSLVIGPPPPTEAAAVTGLVLNLCMPGVGSIVAGKPGPGIAQLAMLVAGVPLCFVLIGFPLVFAAWLWSIMTAASALQEARRAPA